MVTSVATKRSASARGKGALPGSPGPAHGRRRPVLAVLGPLTALAMVAPGGVLTPAAARAQGLHEAPGAPSRPAWVVDGVPDTVRALVERSAAEPDGDRAKKLLREAEHEARAAVERRPDEVARRFALAVVLGLRADAEGGRTKVRAAAALHEELEAILLLEPDHARARHMLGRLHAGVMRMNGILRWLATNLLGGDALEDASWEEAERHLAFAEAREPSIPDHHLQLANLYRDTDRPALALQEVVHVLELPTTSPMEERARTEALHLEEELRQEMDEAPHPPEPGAGRDTG